tara:strand:+ start:3504 stop:4844 length:1341 start_codon:yes stop_codon:yes gene_type:complete
MTERKLHLLYRPDTFTKVLGQDGTVKILSKALKNGTVPKEIIFHGGWGSGKTTTARILARALLCENRAPDDPNPCNECASCQSFFRGTHAGYIEVDGANMTKVDDFRKIIESTEYHVAGSNARVYVIDECHMMSRSAQNVALKTLEEGREGVYFFFCTTEYHKILDTIRSRCMDFRIRPIPSALISERVMEICKIEGIPYEQKAVELLVDSNHGHFREVLVFAGKVKDIGGVTLEVLSEELDLGLVETYFEILKSLKENDLDTMMQLIHGSLRRTTAQSVYNGLIESCVDVYKHSLGLPMGQAVHDIDLVSRVATLYGQQALKVSKALSDMGSRQVDPNYLVSTLLFIHSKVTSQPTAAPVPQQSHIVHTPAAPPTQKTLQSRPMRQVSVETPRTEKTRHTLTPFDDRARKKPEKKNRTVKPRVTLDESTPISESDFQTLLQGGLR